MAQSLTLLTIILPHEKSHMLYKKVTTHTKKSQQVTTYIALSAIAASWIASAASLLAYSFKCIYSP